MKIILPNLDKDERVESLTIEASSVGRYDIIFTFRRENIFKDLQADEYYIKTEEERWLPRRSDRLTISTDIDIDINVSFYSLASTLIATAYRRDLRLPIPKEVIEGGFTNRDSEPCIVEDDYDGHGYRVACSPKVKDGLAVGIYLWYYGSEFLLRTTFEDAKRFGEELFKLAEFGQAYMRQMRKKS